MRDAEAEAAFSTTQVGELNTVVSLLVNVQVAVT